MKKDIESKLSKTLIHSITQRLFASGVLSEDDIKDQESHRLALKRIIDNGGIDAMTINYTESLIEKAKKNIENPKSMIFHEYVMQRFLNIKLMT